MSDFLIAPAARIELDEIWDYYALELQNPDAASATKFSTPFTNWLKRPVWAILAAIWPQRHCASGLCEATS